MHGQCRNSFAAHGTDATNGRKCAQSYRTPFIDQCRRTIDAGVRPRERTVAVNRSRSVLVAEIVRGWRSHSGLVAGTRHARPMQVRLRVLGRRGGVRRRVECEAGATNSAPTRTQNAPRQPHTRNTLAASREASPHERASEIGWLPDAGAQKDAWDARSTCP